MSVHATSSSKICSRNETVLDIHYKYFNKSFNNRFPGFYNAIDNASEEQIIPKQADVKGKQQSLQVSSVCVRFSMALVTNMVLWASLTPPCLKIHCYYCQCVRYMSCHSAVIVFLTLGFKDGGKPCPWDTWNRRAAERHPATESLRDFGIITKCPKSSK